MKKQIIITKCRECPWFEEFDSQTDPRLTEWYTKWACNNEQAFIEEDEIDSFPKWCPLEDAKG